jgi:hypothetical protein
MVATLFGFSPIFPWVRLNILNQIAQMCQDKVNEKRISKRGSSRLFRVVKNIFEMVLVQKHTKSKSGH